MDQQNYYETKITDPSIAKEAYQELCQLNDLNEIDIYMSESGLNDQDVLEFLHILKNHKNITVFKLDLGCLPVTDVIAQPLTDILLSLTSLTTFELTLSETKVTDAAIISIIQSLRQSNLLQSFTFNISQHYQKLYDSSELEITDKAVFEINTTLTQLPNLTTFSMDLESTKVTDASIMDLAKALRQIKGIQIFMLTLGKTQITELSVNELSITIRSLNSIDDFSIDLSNTNAPKNFETFSSKEDFLILF